MEYQCSTALYKDKLHSTIVTSSLTFRFPVLSGNPLEDVEPPSHFDNVHFDNVHFELPYTHSTHYNSIVSLAGELCKDLPELNNEEVYTEEVLYIVIVFLVRAQCVRTHVQ